MLLADDDCDAINFELVANVVTLLDGVRGPLLVDEDGTDAFNDSELIAVRVAEK